LSQTNVSHLQKLLSGMPMPNPPQYNEQWTLDRYQQEMVIFHRKLLEYIQRLMHQLTGKNLLTEIGLDIGDLRYDTTSKQIQVKRYASDGSLGDWEMVTGGQAVEYP